ncbi:MAG TPA: DUF2071 domain-containing protein [Luteolibacter sp.]|nr:DUF2071 domain-containing protein [Luteolibacter sp.]
MNIPTITGIIRRRILVNYRADAAVVQAQLPSNFRPKLFQGQAIVGICLIRLEQIRPQGMPAIIGIASENAAHRVAVEWQDEQGQAREGVFISRRDTDSQLNALAGGRLFPGVHHLSRFDVSDEAGRITLRVQTEGQEQPLVDLVATETDAFPADSIFANLEASSRFFEAGCVGYSVRPDSCILDGLLLEVSGWSVSPLKVESVHSAYFDNPALYPAGSATFDHALIMRDIAHLWKARPQMRTEKEVLR